MQVLFFITEISSEQGTTDVNQSAAVATNVSESQTEQPPDSVGPSGSVPEESALLNRRKGKMQYMCISAQCSINE